MPPSAATTLAYEGALPTGPEVARKTMFGSPCAFVNRQMFFGTFEESLVARVGPSRAAALAAQGEATIFIPTEGRPWSDYVAIPSATAADTARALAAEALAWTRALPPKGKPSRAVRKSRR